MQHDFLDKLSEELIVVRNNLRSSHLKKALSKYETHCKTHGEFVEADHRGCCMQCLTEQQRSKRHAATGVGSGYRNATFENYVIKTQEQKIAIEALANYDGEQNIVLLGKTGTGKTHIASALINRALAYNSNPAFVKFYQLPHIQINDYDRFCTILNSDFLVLDEFGVQGTDYKLGLAYEIYDYRYDMQLPTMLISNLTPEQLKGIMTDALYSRIKSNCISLVLTGDDYRLSGTLV